MPTVDTTIDARTKPIVTDTVFLDFDEFWHRVVLQGKFMFAVSRISFGVTPTPAP